MRTLIACLVQLGLLTYFYADPASRVMPGEVYLALVAINSGLLLYLSYQSFRQQRVLVAIIAALLAFPALVLLAAILAFWGKKL